ERIRIGREQIGDDDFAVIHELVDRLAERLVGEGKLPWHPSFFEMLTAIAFESFSRRKGDIAGLEGGVGGGGHPAQTAAGQRCDREYDSGVGSARGECGAVCSAGKSGEQ